MAKFLTQWRKWCARPERLRAAFVGCAMLLSTACASHSYMGISLVSGQASPEVQELARRAQSGDKQAQLDLGIRFEEGRGVPKDEARAVKLYKQAASDSGGAQWIYVPSPGNGAKARVMSVQTGLKQTGLEEAKTRIEKLEMAE